MIKATVCHPNLMTGYFEIWRIMENQWKSMNIRCFWRLRFRAPCITVFGPTQWASFCCQPHMSRAREPSLQIFVPPCAYSWPKWISVIFRKQLLQLPAGAWLKWIRKREDGPVLQQDLGASARAQGDANLDVGLGRSGKDHHPLQVEICRSGGDHSNSRRGMKIDDAP